MAKSFDTSLGTVRVYEFNRPARQIAGTPLAAYRARLYYDGKLRDGKVSPTHRLAVESLFEKLGVGACRQKPILAHIGFPAAVGNQTAMSQPSAVKKLVHVSKKRPPTVHVFRQRNSQKAAIRYFPRLTDNKKSNAANSSRSQAYLFQLA